MQFFRDTAYVWAGTLLAPLGVGTGVAEWLRYRRKRTRIGVWLPGPTPTPGP